MTGKDVIVRFYDLYFLGSPLVSGVVAAFTSSTVYDASGGPSFHIMDDKVDSLETEAKVRIEGGVTRLLGGRGGG